MSDYAPKSEHKFTFGLWTVGNPGRDPFGEPTRTMPTPIDSVRKLSKIGAYGVNFHDNDLVPFGASTAERERIVKEFKAVLISRFFAALRMTKAWPDSTSVTLYRASTKDTKGGFKE